MATHTAIASWTRNLGPLRKARAFLIVLTVACTLAASTLEADTLRVPADYATIQSAIEAANPDDTILVSPGVYLENLDTLEKSLIIRSEMGAQSTVVDGADRGRALRIGNEGCVIDGFTFRRGYHEYEGGGLWIYPHANTVIRNNIIEENVAGYYDSGRGGGIYIPYIPNMGGVAVENNHIRNNYAGDSGGGIYDSARHDEFRGNIISGNSCHVAGGGAYLAGGSIFVENLVIENWADSFGGGVYGGGREILNNTIVGNFTYNFPWPAGIMIRHGIPLIANNIVVHNVGVGIHCSSSANPRLRCNDSWGNQGGDYFLHAYSDTTNGRNFSADPIFCAEDSGDFRISEQSPCAPSQNPSCGLVGAFSTGCGATAIEATTWGKIKAFFR